MCDTGTGGKVCDNVFAKPCLIVKRVVAGRAGQCIIASPADEFVIARAAVERVYGSVTCQDVIGSITRAVDCG